MNLAGVSIFCFAACYTLALLLEIWQFRRPSRAGRLTQQAVTFAGIVAQVIYISQHGLTTTANSTTLLFLSLILAIFYFSGSLHYQRFAWGLFILPVVLGLVLLAWLRPERQPFVLPASEAPRLWMQAHILFILLGFVGLCIAFLASVMYLVQSTLLRKKLAPDGGMRLMSLERLEGMNRRAIVLAFPLVSSGLLLGFLLLRQTAQLPWNDPKVLATIPVWIVMGLLLLARYWLHLPPRRLAWLSVLCFCLMLLSLAVPWLWPSAHPTGGLGP